MNKYGIGDEWEKEFAGYIYRADHHEGNEEVVRKDLISEIIDFAVKQERIKAIDETMACLQLRTNEIRYKKLGDLQAQKQELLDN